MKLTSIPVWCTLLCITTLQQCQVLSQNINPTGSHKQATSVNSTHLLHGLLLGILHLMCSLRLHLCLEYDCHLSAEIIDALFGEVWNVTDAVVEEYGLQGIVNCTKQGDILSLQTSKTIQPDNRIVIPQSLSIFCNGKVSMTCPGDDGLFLIGCVQCCIGCTQALLQACVSHLQELVD